jgi:hypothetical protein
MPHYLLALYDSPDTFDQMGPEEMQQIVERYRAWSAGLASGGHLVDGRKLEDGTGRVLSRNGSGGLAVSDGPYAETKEILGGFFLIQAESYDHAAELTRDCPHLEYGTVEIRAIDPAGDGDP